MEYVGIPKKTPLYDEHLAENGRIVDFSGWLLPVQYSSILKEHIHTRENNSIFDICHMGEFLFEGPAAEADLARILTCDPAQMKNGSCRYCFILNHNGCFIDDAILFRYGSGRFMLVVNAGRTEADMNWIKPLLSFGTSFTDISSSTAKLDLQGPSAPETAAAFFNSPELLSLKSFTFSELEYRGKTVTVSATGYTGERGYELFIPAETAVELWRELISVDGVEPAGLGARDSLRLEKGFSLYGHDISEEINPFEAGLGRFINLDRDFIGSDALREIKKNGIKRKLSPFLCEGRRSARDGFDVFFNDKKIGYVTSGAYSPILKRGIGLCMIETAYTDKGTDIICLHDDVQINATVTGLPFVR